MSNKAGLRTTVPKSLRPYKTRSDKLTVQGDFLLWGIRSRVTVPEKLRGDVLKELHSSHRYPE